MELPVISDGVQLASYRTNFPLSVTNEKTTSEGFGESGYYQSYGDGSSVTSRAPGALTGYETLDAPPHYDFYANTEVWGRRRRLRPSLYELHANREDDSRPPMYEETTAGKDSSEEEEDEQTQPPSEPARFGWVQGVMVCCSALRRAGVPKSGPQELLSCYFYDVPSPTHLNKMANSLMHMSSSSAEAGNEPFR